MTTNPDTPASPLLDDDPAAEYTTAVLSDPARNALGPVGTTSSKLDPRGPLGLLLVLPELIQGLSGVRSKPYDEHELLSDYEGRLFQLLDHLSDTSVFDRGTSYRDYVYQLERAAYRKAIMRLVRAELPLLDRLKKLNEKQTGRWGADGPAKTLELLEKQAAIYGREQLHHPAFPPAFVQRVRAMTPATTHLHLRDFCQEKGVICSDDLTYLGGILEEALTQETDNRLALERALNWIRAREVTTLAEEATHAAALSTPAPLGAAPTPAYQWLGTDVDLAELGYALLAAGLLAGAEINRAGFVQALGQFLGGNVPRPVRSLESICDRKAKGNEGRTYLLNKLRDQFNADLDRREAE